MKKLKNKIPMLILVISVYVWISLLIQDKFEAFGYFAIVLFVLFLLNLIAPFFQRKDNKNGKEYAFLAMIGKIALIPAFIFIFFCGFALAVVPGFFILIPILVIVDYALVLATSIYEIFALVSAYKSKMISAATLAIHIILSLLFCLDVFSSIYVFAKIKIEEKRNREKEAMKEGKN